MHEEKKSGCHWTSKTGRKLSLIKIFLFLNSVLASVLNICWLTAENLSSLLWHAFEHQRVQNIKVPFPPVITATRSSPVSKNCYIKSIFAYCYTAKLLLHSLTQQNSKSVCSPRQPVCPSFPGLCQLQKSKSTNIGQPYLFPLNLD